MTIIRAKPVTNGATDVTRSVTSVIHNATHCPTCGRMIKVHSTAAARQKAYRERLKAKRV